MLPIEKTSFKRKIWQFKCIYILLFQWWASVSDSALAYVGFLLWAAGNFYVLHVILKYILLVYQSSVIIHYRRPWNSLRHGQWYNTNPKESQVDVFALGPFKMLPIEKTSFKRKIWQFKCIYILLFQWWASVSDSALAYVGFLLWAAGNFYVLHVILKYILLVYQSSVIIHYRRPWIAQSFLFRFTQKMTQRGIISLWRVVSNFLTIVISDLYKCNVRQLKI